MKGDTAVRPTTQQILEAASRLVLSTGVAGLTLEAVAHEAGVSKGGLLYHFPTKRTLIAGMVTYLASRYQEAINLAADTEVDRTSGGAWLRAYIRACTDVNEQERALSVALLAAMATEPALLEPIQAHYRDWQKQVEHSGMDPALATILRLAADGLWFADLFNLAPPTGPFRQQVVDCLIQLTRRQV